MLYIRVPYKDKTKQREYQKNWIANRRKSWLEVNGPCRQCGSWSDLEIHHRDPQQKVEHRIWSWSKDRFKAEIEKCDVLCDVCHVRITADMRMPDHGTPSRYHHKKRPCRCNLCREARRLEAAWYRSRPQI